MAYWCTREEVLAQSGCTGYDGDPDDLDTYRQAASDALFALSGRQFGTRTVTVRPCAAGVADVSRPIGWHDSWGRVGAASQGWCSCGRPSLACSCGPGPSQVALGLGPVVDVVTVKVDGEVLVEGVDYRLDEGTWLVRLPDAAGKARHWPTTQRVDRADSEDDTWSVAVEVGTVVPALGRLAAAELACELSRLGDDGCALSPRVSAVNNQGVQLQFIGLSEALQGGQTGLPQVDLFLATYNPRRVPARARVLFPPPSGVRRTDTDGPS